MIIIQTGDNAQLFNNTNTSRNYCTKVLLEFSKPKQYTYYDTYIIILV